MFKAAFLFGLAIAALETSYTAQAVVEPRPTVTATGKPKPTFEELYAIITPKIIERANAKEIEAKAYVLYVGGACSHIMFAEPELTTWKTKLASVKAADELEAAYFDLAWQDGERFTKSQGVAAFDKTQCRRALEKALKDVGS